MKKILWLDNEPNNWPDYVDLLERNGLSVKQIENFSDAVECLKEEGFDLFITDVMFLGENAIGYEDLIKEASHDELDLGFYFYRHLQKNRLIDNLKVMVITNRTDSGIKRMFFEEGLPKNHFVPRQDLQNKPQILYQKIIKILD